MIKMKPDHLRGIIAVCIACISLSACKSDSFDDRTENLNKGTLTLYAESSYKVLVEELIQSYENVYPESDIQAVYATDAEVIAAMITDKTRMAFLGSGLTEEQKSAIEKSQGIPPDQFAIGREAIAVIASRTNSDTVFDFDAFLQSRSTGYTGKYAQTSFVFNKENSSMIAALIGNTGDYKQMFSLNDVDTVVGYVAKNPTAVGFISFATISDFDDPEVMALLKQIKVLAVAKADSSGKQIVTPLSQSTIASNDYPFQRYVTVIKGNVPELLGTGFVNFLYRSKASRIMLKAGLVPEKMPERQVKIVE